ncbi:MAG: ABC transporter substrate-binding protein [Bacteroidota bacterium]|nr:ABC transporter substrate-binding protein [Bacteroidota bacterium]
MSCDNSIEKSTDKSYIDFPVKKDTSIHYAKRFSISENEKFKCIYLFGNADIKDTTGIYIILKDSTLNLKKAKDEFFFKTSCKKIASLSSVYTNMFCELNALQNVSAIENVDYYNNAEVIEKFNNQKLIELVKGSEIDIEKTIVLNPDIIFSFGMNGDKNGENKKIEWANIPTVFCLDHLEETPLARAEWIKFYAAFVRKEQLADSIFKMIEKNYLSLETLASTAKTQPTVFTEIKYGDVWYVPGGKSFVATLLKDANANYVFKDDTHTGSLNLSFEEVYTTAKNADYWLNLALVNSKNELLSFEPRYAEFNAFKKGNLYNNNKIVNQKGYSNYWETAIIYPDRVLSDLILIFHPELNTEIKGELNYYKKIK